MAQIYNSEVIKRILEDCKIQLSKDAVPSKLASKVVPVLIANPEKKLQAATETLSDGTSGTIFTTSSTKRTFFVGGAAITF